MPKKQPEVTMPPTMPKELAEIAPLMKKLNEEMVRLDLMWSVKHHIQLVPNIKPIPIDKKK